MDEFAPSVKNPEENKERKWSLGKRWQQSKPEEDQTKTLAGRIEGLHLVVMRKTSLTRSNEERVENIINPERHYYQRVDLSVDLCSIISDNCEKFTEEDIKEGDDNNNVNKNLEISTNSNSLSGLVTQKVRHV